jgi:DeoR/GlpR family transcriptional regulator of sugar metabolism
MPRRTILVKTPLPFHGRVVILDVKEEKAKKWLEERQKQSLSEKELIASLLAGIILKD